MDVHHIEHQRNGGEHGRSNCCVLCSTHHRQFHEGQLRVEGDADTELRFYDELGETILTGRQLGAVQMTQCGSPSARAEVIDAAAEASSAPDLSPEAAQLLRAMGHRGGWHPDALCSATGVSQRQVAGALLTLVLAGWVEETFGRYQAVR